MYSFTRTIIISKVLLALGVFIFSSHSQAALTPVGDMIHVSVLVAENEHGKDKNDCPGYFGENFGDCKITHVPSGDTTVFAEIMAKFDGETPSDNAFNSPSQASDWTFNGGDSNPGNAGSGTWSYVGTEYPGVTYWVAKAASSGFILNWMINSEDESACTAPNEEFSISCLSVAQTVTSGTWLTPENHKGENRGLSHISFFGKTDPVRVDVTVPEPSSLILFALALGGLVVRQKRSKS